MEEEKKIYIGNLEFGLSEEELKGMIESKGIAVQEVRIVKDKFSGRSKGFGFAEFESQELNGRTLRVNKAQKMKPRRDNFRPNTRPGRFDR